MLENVPQLIEKYKTDLARLQEQASRLKEQPLVFLEELTGENQEIIPTLLSRYQSDAVYAYQKDVYVPLMMELQKKFAGLKNIALSYDETTFPSPIYFTSNDVVVGELHPYARTFVIRLPEAVQECQEKILNEEEEMSELQVELALREMEEQNPLLLAKGKLSKIVSLSLNKKKTMASIRKQANEQLEAFSQLNRNKLNLQNKLEDLNGLHLPGRLQMQRFAVRLSELYHITPANEYVEFESWVFQRRLLLEQQAAQSKERAQFEILKAQDVLNEAELEQWRLQMDETTAAVESIRQMESRETELFEKPTAEEPLSE